MKNKILCCIIASALTPTVLHAETLQEQEQALNLVDTWKIYTGVEYSRNGYKDDAHLADRTLSGSAIIKYNYSEDVYFTGNIYGYHSYDGKRGDYWNDAWLTVKKKHLWDPTDDLTMSAGARILIPVSEKSQDTDLQTAIRGNVRFTLSLDNILDGLQIGDSIRVQKNFHKYKTAGNKLLEEHRLTNLFFIDYSVRDWFLSVSLTSSKSWDYDNNNYSPKLAHAEEIGYEFTDNFNVALGMTNSATYYDPDRGPNPLDKLLDAKDLTYYMALNFSY